MTKKTNKYRLTLEQVSLVKEGEALQSPMHLEFENHDELFDIIEIVKTKNLFEDKRHSTEFAIGLKLFSEVMLKHKTHPLFEEIFPVMGDFMKKLKSS